jgi:MFS family permease
MAGILAGGWLFGRAAGASRDDGALVLGVLAQLAGVAAVIALAALVDAPAWLFPLWLVGGLLNGGTNVFDNLLMASRVPPERRGRAFAALGAAGHGAGMAGFLAGGVLLGHVSPRPLVAGLGLAGLAVVAALVVPVRRAVRLERATVDHHERTAASAGRAHPVPELPADLLGADAVGRAPGRGPAQGLP